MAQRLWKHVSARQWPEEPNVHLEVSVTLREHVVSIVFAPFDSDVLEPVMVTAARADADRVSPRDIQKLPLGRVVEVARALLTAPGVIPAIKTGKGQPWIDIGKLDRIRVPNRKSPDFYLQIAATARQLKARNQSPAQELARAMNVSRNLVDQWLHVARRRYGYDC